MANIGSMTLLIEAQSAQLQREIAKVNQTVARSARGIEQQTGLMQRGFDGAARSVALLGRGLATLGIGIGLGAMVSATRNAIAFADALDDLSTQTGVSSRRLQELRETSIQTGGSAQALDRGVQIFARGLGNAAAGVGTLRGALGDMGISIFDAGGNIRSTEAVLIDFVDAASEAESAAERARLANLAFGKGGAELAGLLTLTRQELRAYAEDTSVVSDSTVRALAESQAAIDRFSNALNANFVTAAGNAIATGEGLVEVFKRLAGVSEASRLEELAAQQFDLAAQMDAAAQAAASGDRVAQARLETLRMTAQALTDEMAALQATERATKSLRAAVQPATEDFEQRAEATTKAAASTTRLLVAERNLLTLYRNDNEADLRVRQLRSQQRIAEELATEQERLANTTRRAIADPVAVSPMGDLALEPFRNAIGDAQATMTDFFESALSGSIKTFSDMADAFRQVFIRGIANAASVALFNPGALAAMFSSSPAAATAGAPGATGAFGTNATWSQLAGIGALGAAGGGLFGGAIGGQSGALGGSLGGLGGAAAGALIGSAFPVVGTVLGGALGGLVGGAGGGLLGSLFGGGDKKTKFSGSGGLGQLSGGEVGAFLAEIDRGLQEILNVRQRQLVDAALRQSPVSVRAKDFDPNVQAFAASQRIGPAATALGFNTGAITSAGSAQGQLQNLQTALEVQDAIRRLTEGTFAIQTDDLALSFEDLTSKARRFGVSLAGVADAQERATRDLQRSQDQQLAALLDPFDALANPLKEFQKQVEFAALGPAQQFAKAQQDFAATAAAARGGDLTALGEFTGVASRFIDLSTAHGASPGQASALRQVGEVLPDLINRIEIAEDRASASVKDSVDRWGRAQAESLDQLGRVNTNHVDDQGEMDEGGEHEVELFEA